MTTAAAPAASPAPSTAPSTPTAGEGAATPAVAPPAGDSKPRGGDMARAADIARKVMERSDAGKTESVVEAPTEEAKAEPEKVDAEPEKKDEPAVEPNGKAFRKLRLKEQALKELERKAQADLAEAAKWRAEKEADDKLKAEDPYGWARKHGLNFRDLAKKAVGEETKDPRDKAIEELRAELAELKGETATRKEREQTEAEKAAHADILATASDAFASTTPDEFPYLHEHAPAQVAAALKAELIDHYQKTGEDLSIIPNGLRGVMARLEKQMATYIEEKHSRVTARRKPPEPEPKPAPKPKAPPENGDVTARAAAARVSPEGTLSQAERMRRATERARDVIRR
jgi:hypothetical protein